MNLLANLAIATVGLFILNKSFCNAMQGEYITSSKLNNKRLSHEIKSKVATSQEQCLEFCKIVSLFLIEIRDSAIKRDAKYSYLQFIIDFETKVFGLLFNHCLQALSD